MSKETIDKNEEVQTEQQAQDTSRRNFMKYTGTAIGSVVVGGLVGSLIGCAPKEEEAQQPAAPAEKLTKNFSQALMYFTQDQFAITEAAVERIFPADDLGAGAKDLGVAYYIDHQLAGAWGINARDYMMGPFYEADAEQGYQLGFKRHELFSMGIDGLREYSTKKFQDSFTKITPEEQDVVLTAFEKDEATLKGVPASTFFALLRQLTIEGVYADPLYSGNKNMDGWRMRNYPGDQMSYFEQIEQDGLVKLEPLSLHDHLNMG
ncbi:MAG: gluconate 2-dehydrogenase subunit 3 family protein [Candidatus Pristimantibacillus sp.]